MKRLLILFLLSNVLLIPSVWAADSNGALELAKNTTERMQTALNKNKTQLQSNSASLYDLVAEIVLPHFGFNTICKRQFPDVQKWTL